MRKRVAGLVMCFVMAVPLTAQVDRASVGGTVTDSSGAVVKGARIGAASSSTGFQRWTVTSDAGAFYLPGLPIGTYKVTVEKEGFKSITIDRVVLSIGEERTFDARLDVGGITEEVQVSTTLDDVDRSSAEVGAVIDSAQIREVPLNGRSFATLMMLAPGAINSGGGTERDIRFNGRCLSILPCLEKPETYRTATHPANGLIWCPVCQSIQRIRQFTTGSTLRRSRFQRREPGVTSAATSHEGLVTMRSMPQWKNASRWLRAGVSASGPKRSIC